MFVLTGVPVISRGCTSSLLVTRADFPLEQYEGCRYGKMVTQSPPVAAGSLPTTNGTVTVPATNFTASNPMLVSSYGSPYAGMVGANNNPNVMYCFCGRRMCNKATSNLIGIHTLTSSILALLVNAFIFYSVFK